MIRRIVVLTIALGLTWMVFFGANYFGAVWTHYFSGDSAQNTGEVSVKIIRQPLPNVGASCDKDHPCPKAPHE